MLAYLLALNITTFVYYAYDKWVAGSGFTRIPENILHGMAFLGGSPAALAAQKFFRHKTAKKSFQFVFWLLVVLQAIVLVFYYTG